MARTALPKSDVHPNRGPGLSRVLRYEFVRLTTVRSTYVLAAAALLSSLVPLLAASTLSTSSAAAGSIAPRLIWTSVATAPLGVLTVVLGVLGAMAAGHEFRYGTMQLALLRCPHRGLLLGAKLMVASLLGTTLSLVSVLLGLAWVAAVYTWSDLGGDAVSTGDIVALLLRLAAASVFWVIVGFTIACWTQSLQLGIAVPLIWSNVVEPFILLSSDVRDGAVAALLPFSAARDGVTGSLGQLAVVGADGGQSPNSAVCVVVAATLLGLSFRSFLRSDV